MYVSSRYELTVKIKKGCKDAEYFLDLQAGFVFTPGNGAFNNG